MAKYAEAAPKILELIEQGATYKDAAEQVGIGETTFYRWLEEKGEFRESVKRAKEAGTKMAVAKVEATLLQLATGYEYEDVRTEYESKVNPDPDAKEKYIPTIKKQVRTKKRVIANVEAIKFFLTNKAPDDWKNRLEQNNTGSLCTDLRVNFVGGGDGESDFPSSEADVDAVREQ